MNKLIVLVSILMIVSLVMGQPHKENTEGFLSRSVRQIKSTFNATVRKLLRVVVDGMKDLYNRVRSIETRVYKESREQYRLQKLVMELSQRVNASKSATDLKIKDIFTQMVNRVESSREMLQRAISEQGEMLGEGLARVNERIDKTKIYMAQLQTELVEGTFMINKTIYNISLLHGEGSVRIVGGGSRGKVEVLYLGEWTLICDDTWTFDDAVVVCKMLGYTTIQPLAYETSSGSNSTVARLDKIECSGNEAKLSNCPHIGSSIFHACPTNIVAAVDCEPHESSLLTEEMTMGEFGLTTEESTTSEIVLSTGKNTNGFGLSAGYTKEETTAGQRPESLSEILLAMMKRTTRLVGGGNGTVGRLEVKHDGIWGTVCDDGWNADQGHYNARVVCRYLNLPTEGATAYYGNRYPFSSDVSADTPIWLDNVHCLGEEDSIFECRHNGFAKHNCKSSENVGVKCA